MFLGISKLVVTCIYLAVVGCGQTLIPTPAVVVEKETSPSSERPTPTITARPTSTPRPATPTPIPTPTMTPTPIIYAIEPGDTLLSIAIQFDRSTERIQEANGIVDPRLLQIGQELIIPPPPADEEDPPTPTPTPLPLLIEGLNFEETRQGTLWCLGEVRNPADSAVAEVVVEAVLFDGEGVLLSRETTFAQLDVVQPGEAVPFAILFQTPPDTFAQYQVVAISGVPVSEEARYYFDLQAVEVRGKPVSVTLYRMTGELHNRGERDAEAIRLVAVAYDEDDRVLAQRQVGLEISLLKAGATTPFTVDLTITQGIVDRFNVVAQGLGLETP